MKIAVEGCCHGELDKIYETLTYLEETNNIKVDLLIICGDFQAVRNKADLHCMAVPPKYQQMNTFYKYYSGEKKVPVLTIFIGGNHEASNYMQELPYGGWVAPNIYYMGYANVVQFGGLRIAGLSGIYKPKHYTWGHYEHPPYSEDSKRSAYHIRNVDVFRLKQITRPLDIVLSHDWPRGIYNFGNIDGLLRHKPFLAKEIEENSLGSPPAEEVLHKLKPDYWFSAHLHTKFAALVEHLPDGDGASKTTKFLSLDKCLPKRRFLQVIDFPREDGSPPKLELDPEWLCILKSTNHLVSLKKYKQFMPGPGCSERWDFTITDQEIESITEDFGNDLTVPENFTTTVPAYTEQDAGKRVAEFPPPAIRVNPQTTLLCTMLELSDPNAIFLGRDSSFNLDATDGDTPANQSSLSEDEGDSDIDDDDDVNTTFESSMDATFNSSCNPDEIEIPSDNDDEDEGISEMDEENENEADVSISTTSSGPGDGDAEGEDNLSGIAAIDDQSVNLSSKQEEDDELHEILATQAGRSRIKGDNSDSDNAVSSTTEAGPARLKRPEIDTSDPQVVSSSLAISGQAESVTFSSQDEEDEDDDELHAILAAQKLKIKSPSSECDGVSSNFESTTTTTKLDSTTTSAPNRSPRSTGSKQKSEEDTGTKDVKQHSQSKKLKRRNLSMYSGDERTDDESA